MVRFERAGKHNTEEALRVGVAFSRDNSLPLVVASCSGSTAAMALDHVRGAEESLIVVSHNTGFFEPFEQRFDPLVRARIEAEGGRVLTGTLPLRGVGAAVRMRFGGSEEELINAALRIFCQGAKVCVEMAAMVADAGLVGDTDIVAVAGTGKGADTACLVSPKPSNRFFDIRVRCFLCKPMEF